VCEREFTVIQIIFQQYDVLQLLDKEDFNLMIDTLKMTEETEDFWLISVMYSLKTGKVQRKGASSLFGVGHRNLVTECPLVPWLLVVESA
jgi:hypothetical protein